MLAETKEQHVNSNRESQRGQVLILVAASLLALMGFVALVIDVGFLYYGRANAANAADAAVMAGTQLLPIDPTGARATAVEYATRNGIPADKVTVEISPDSRSMTVRVTNDVQLYFARALGFETARVGAKAGSKVGALKSLNGAVPLGVQKQNFVYGAQYYLKSSPGTLGSYQGNFGALALGGNGASVYRENLANGYDEELHIGDIIDTQPGNMSGPTTQGLSGRIDADSDSDYTTVSPDSTRIIKAPVIEYITDHGGRTQVRVVGFAAFFLEGVGGSGRDNYVVGRFLRMVAASDTGGIDVSGGDSGYDYGLYTYKLVE